MTSFENVFLLLALSTMRAQNPAAYRNAKGRWNPGLGIHLSIYELSK
jgi:hypothetical protein